MSRFSVENFLPHSAEKYPRMKSFGVSLISGIEKAWIRKCGETQGCLSKIFVSKCQKNSQGNPSVLCFRKIPLARKFMDRRGVSIKIFRRSFLYHIAE